MRTILSAPTPLLQLGSLSSSDSRKRTRWDWWTNLLQCWLHHSSPEEASEPMMKGKSHCGCTLRLLKVAILQAVPSILWKKTLAYGPWLMTLAKYLGSIRLKNRDEEISGKLVYQSEFCCYHKMPESELLVKQRCCLAHSSKGTMMQASSCRFQCTQSYNVRIVWEREN